MTKVHSGLLNMDKSTCGVSRKGVSFGTTRHNVNRRVQTNDLITSGLGGGERDSFIQRRGFGSSFFNLVCFVFILNGEQRGPPTNHGRRENSCLQSMAFA